MSADGAVLILSLETSTLSTHDSVSTLFLESFFLFTDDSFPPMSSESFSLLPDVAVLKPSSISLFSSAPTLFAMTSA